MTYRTSFRHLQQSALVDFESGKLDIFYPSYGEELLLDNRKVKMMSYSDEHPGMIAITLEDQLISEKDTYIDPDSIQNWEIIEIET